MDGTRATDAGRRVERREEARERRRRDARGERAVEARGGAPECDFDEETARLSAIGEARGHARRKRKEDAVANAARIHLREPIDARTRGREIERVREQTPRRVWLGRHAFDVDERYDPIKTVGRGAYGVVCSANDRVAPHGARNTVAIKKLTNCFDSPVEARRALREVHLLRRLKHENVIRLEDIMMPVGDNGRMDDVYLVYELMDTDLHQIIRSKQALLDEHCQYFIYQILRGLKYVHSAKVLHRDLKPSNILLNANCDLCICDFGLARSMVERGRMMTSYVVTRWYRAPELLLNSEEYAASIDMWSVGCILAEIIDRKPLFPGKDFIHQMRLIIETLGSPEEDDMDFISSPYARKYIASLPRKPKVNFAAIYPNANPLAIDLLERTLVFDPRRRISVDDALAHPYLASLHDSSNEPTYAPAVDDPHFKSLDEPDAHIPDEYLREAIYNQMLDMKSERAAARASSISFAFAPRAQTFL